MEILLQKHPVAAVSLIGAVPSSGKPMELSGVTAGSANGVGAVARVLRVIGTKTSPSAAPAQPIEVVVPATASACRQLRGSNYERCRRGAPIPVQALTVELKTPTPLEFTLEHPRNWSLTMARRAFQQRPLNGLSIRSSAPMGVFVDCLDSTPVAAVAPAASIVTRCDLNGDFLRFVVTPPSRTATAILLDDLAAFHLDVAARRVAVPIDEGELVAGGSASAVGWPPGQAVEVSSQQGQPASVNFEASNRVEGRGMRIDAPAATVAHVGGDDVRPSCFDLHESLWNIFMGALIGLGLGALGVVLLGRPE